MSNDAYGWNVSAMISKWISNGGMSVGVGVHRLGGPPSNETDHL